MKKAIQRTVRWVGAQSRSEWMWVVKTLVVVALMPLLAGYFVAAYLWDTAWHAIMEEEA